MRRRIRIGLVAGIALAAMPAWAASAQDEVPTTRRAPKTQAAPRQITTVTTTGVGAGVDFLLFDDAPAAKPSTTPRAFRRASADHQEQRRVEVVQARSTH